MRDTKREIKRNVMTSCHHEPQEKIQDVSGEGWVCICGNTAYNQGFYPCDVVGQEVSPTVEEWTTNWYVCGECGRMIDQKTLNVVGRRKSTLAWQLP